MRGKTPFVFLSNTVEAAPICRIKLAFVSTAPDMSAGIYVLLVSCLDVDVLVEAVVDVPRVEVDCGIAGILTNQIPCSEDTQCDVLWVM